MNSMSRKFIIGYLSAILFFLIFSSYSFSMQSKENNIVKNIVSDSLVTIHIDRSMPAPRWALDERKLLSIYGEAAIEFAAKYLDERGFLRCAERWGGNDGPDDAMENFSQWPLVYALGGSDVILDLFSKAWEGHLIQYTQAKAPSVDMAHDGMYINEFITSFDWEHNGEVLAGFHFYGLAMPNDPTYIKRVRKYAGFYLNEDTNAPNYDPKNKIIRSLHNGSRGPKLTDATEIDWGGEPLPGFPERQSRYNTAQNIRGDNPLNLLATTLPMDAYMLTGENKYRDWILEYTGAWRDRILSNGGNIPTNIGLDGNVGSEWGGKWYGGVFGWNFWPQSTGRNYYIRGPRVAFGEAFLLTSDNSFIEPLRQQIANLYAVKKVDDVGTILLPNKYGDNGWYGYIPYEHFDVQRDIYLWSMNPIDLEHINNDPWIKFLLGKNDSYPEKAMQDEIKRINKCIEGIHNDNSNPETRGSNEPQQYNPVLGAVLTTLILGGNDPGINGNILHSRVRYFDSELHRAGLPQDVAALVEKIGADFIVLTLVNTNRTEPHKVIIQAGAYGEHQFTNVKYDSNKILNINNAKFAVQLNPGCGETLKISMKRYVHKPSLKFPW